MKKSTVFLIVSLLVFVATSVHSISNIKSAEATPATLEVPTPYPTIQAAINDANTGDTILVHTGVYYENVIVNKTVSLVGEVKEETIIDGNGKGPTIHVTVSSVSISRFTVRNASSGSAHGIYLDGVSGTTVFDNIIVNNTNGVYLSQSKNNNFTLNTIINNRYGFVISLAGSSGNILRSNSLSENSQNLKLFTSLLQSDFVQDIDSSNTVDGKPIYYLMNQRDMQVPSDAGYVAVINSKNITLKNSILTKNGEGVLLAFTTNSAVDNVNASNTMGLLGNGIVLYHSDNNYILRSTISNNTGAGIQLDTSENNIILGNSVVNNTKGIELRESINNVIYGNTVSNSRGFGIDAFNSVNNTIYHNGFDANALQVSNRNSTNSWDAGYPLGGNFWSNYTGVDNLKGPYQNETGPDDIGDTPHIIDANNTDRYPLIIPPPQLKAFVISVSPFSQNVKPGEPAGYTVTVLSVYSFSDNVRLSGTLNPESSEVSFAFNPEIIVPPPNGLNQSTLTVSVASDAAPATYVLIVNATGTGQVLTDSVEIVVLDIVSPHADAGPDQTVNEDTAVTFDGSGSYDNVGIVDYAWTFIDAGSKVLAGENPTYVFNNPGYFVVTLNVTDAAGNWAIDNVTITVLDVTKPVADAGQNRTVLLGQSITFDGSASTDNVGIVRYEWNFGDESNGTGVRVAHTYMNVGKYKVTLTVKDAAGNSDTASMTVTVITNSDYGLLQRVIVAAIGIIIFVFAIVWLLWKRHKQMPNKQSGERTEIRK